MLTNKQNIIRKAVFPVAGLGTRFLPATKASPKEMLPVVDKPLIQYAVEEAYNAGVRQMIFITGRTKRSIEDHFDTSFELEEKLAATGRKELSDLVKNITPVDMQCVYVRQPRPLGLGHAVLCTQELIGNEPFAVLLADDLMLGEPPIMAQMVEQFKEQKLSILAIETIPRCNTHYYGIVTGHQVNSRLIELNSIIEKPLPKLAPSTLAVAGRYILTPGIFAEIANQQAGIDGEIGLTESIASLLNKESVFAFRYRGQRYDCGSKLGFLKASVDLALRHSEIGCEFSSWIQQRMEQEREEA
jgi:UTP--glucose-1-phosphate uridylyltransferase